jgi:hypothetical protein
MTNASGLTTFGLVVLFACLEKYASLIMKRGAVA